MPQNERLRVWNGTLKRTSGGLKKEDLVKNKRGKIVSKRKSEAAKKNENNLGTWLRSKGDHFLSKGITKENIVRKGKAGRKAFKKKKEYIKAAKKDDLKKQDLKKQVKQSGSSASKSAVKQKSAAPPKISKEEPSKPGDKPKNKTNLDVGNIVTKESMKAEFKSKPLETQWKVKAKAYKKMGFDFNWVQKKLKKKLGIDKPPGVKWNSL